jgi:DNA helicase-2/ATP-dependent DNA helicase PcrA
MYGLMELSTQQQAAVEHTGGPALVVAGAGSGKTRTLTAKFAHLIGTGHEPERILAITFTNKAAEEMKFRLMRQTGLPRGKFPWVRTYHSACFIILKAHCELLGFQPPLQVFAQYQQKKTVKDLIVGRLNMDKKHAPAVLSEISRAKNSGDPGAYFDRSPKVATINLADAYDLYTRSLKSKNAVDFDDILLLARDILKSHDTIRNHYRDLFTYLLVDEYQDTNNLQEELTRLLVKDGNLFCVGDDWQAIYSFRGSNVDHFLSFQDKFPGARIFRLEQNFRSADEVVQIANELINYNDNRMEKECFSDKKGGVVELHEFFDERQEARWVARKINTLKSMGIGYEQMAVLYRTKFCSLAFEQMFRSLRVPYQMLGGKGFFDRKEIMDINCYLSAAAFPQDDVSFERIVNIPKRGIGPGTIKKIARMKTGAMGLQDAARKALGEKILTPKIYGGLEGVLRLLDDIRQLKPAEAISAVIERVGYMDYLMQYARGNTMDMTAREENLDQLIYAASRKETLYDYLEEAALIREDRVDEESGETYGVNLSTVHGAKGLEFGAVFVVGCEEQLFPHWRSLDTESGLEEERRLMYVSITRAEKYLYLSSTEMRKGQFNQRSRFLDEIAEHIY